MLAEIQLYVALPREESLKWLLVNFQIYNIILVFICITNVSWEMLE